MKKTILSIIAIIVMASACLASYHYGYKHGITHAVEESSIWIEEEEDCLEICIEVDGEVYVHEAE